MNAWACILRCRNGRHYVSSHLEGRVADQTTGSGPRLDLHAQPVELVWAGDFDRIIDAIDYQRRIKGWSRARKAALFAGNRTELKRLAQSRSPRPSTGSG